MQHNGSTLPTIDELRQALHRFCEGKQRMCIPAHESDDDIIIDDAFDELSCLRAEVARLTALLTALVVVEPTAIHATQEGYCCYCEGQDGFDFGSAFRHQKDCPWLQAREAVKAL